jgi:hypothetical protein
LEKQINHQLIYADDLLDSSVEIVRHDSKKLASLIQSIIFKEPLIESGKLTNDRIMMQFVLKDSAKMPIKYKSLKALKKIA